MYLTNLKQISNKYLTLMEHKVIYTYINQLNIYVLFYDIHDHDLS